MAENRITEYNKESKTVSWFYNDHKDEKRYDVTDNVIHFINRLIIHIPDYHFLTTRYYGFYANASKKTLGRETTTYIVRDDEALVALLVSTSTCSTLLYLHL